MNETWFEKIEQYLYDEMSAQDKKLFESEMKKNNELSSAFEMYKSIETEMRNKEKYSEKEQALKDSLTKLSSVYFPSTGTNNNITGTDFFKQDKKEQAGVTSKRKKKIWRLLAIAAATIGVIAISLLWYAQSKKENEQVAVSAKTDTGATIIQADTTGHQNSPDAVVQNTNADTIKNKQPETLTPPRQQELFAGNFKPDAVPEITEGPLEDAFTYYANEDYSDAAEEFGSADLTAVTRSIETDTALTAFYADYYAGISYLADGISADAILRLKNALAKSPAELFRVKTEWYLALAYIKSGDIKKANELLKKISANKKKQPIN